jgi:uncharacterized OsmC-like protein
MVEINGMDLDELREFRAAVAKDPTQADRDPVVVATWLGGSRSEATSLADGATAYIGGEGELNPMRMHLATLAACDVDLIATRASLLGVEIESLTVEARGHFNVQRYIGLDAPHGPGYDRVSYTIRLKTRNATPEQLDTLREACQEASPVGDTLQRTIPLTLEFEAG